MQKLATISCSLAVGEISVRSVVQSSLQPLFLQVLNRGLLTGPETKAFRARSLGLHGVKAEPPTCAAFEAELQQEVRQCEEKGELRPELQPLRASNV